MILLINLKAFKYHCYEREDYLWTILRYYWLEKIISQSSNSSSPYIVTRYDNSFTQFYNE